MARRLLCSGSVLERPLPQLLSALDEPIASLCAAGVLDDLAVARFGADTLAGPVAVAGTLVLDGWQAPATRAAWLPALTEVLGGG
ncbi:MAG: hypothetical protein JNL82_01105 [Myxococcales bacterium]|nr:hypothetical protein [Myxococcales bacterium]